MKRTERNEYNYTKRTLKMLDLGYSTVLTVETAGSAEYKQAMNNLYESVGFRACAIKTDPKRFDSQERILYIKADNDEDLCLTSDERAAIRKALAA